MISAETIKKEIRAAMKRFGNYNYFDKGPHEVMDVDSILDQFEGMSSEQVADVLAEVRKLKNGGDEFVREALVCLQDQERLAGIYDDERINDLY